MCDRMAVELERVVMFCALTLRWASCTCSAKMGILWDCADCMIHSLSDQTYTYSSCIIVEQTVQQYDSTCSSYYCIYVADGIALGARVVV